MTKIYFIISKEQKHSKNKKSFPRREKDSVGWQDSNLRPPAPKAGAITGLRYTRIASANIKLNLTLPNYF